MSLTIAQAASEAAKALDCAELYRKTERAAELLSVHDRQRAERIGRQVNDKHAFPVAVLRSRQIFCELGSRQAAFWWLAAHRARHHMLAEEFVANGLRPVFEHVGNGVWGMVTFGKDDELETWGQLPAPSGQWASLPELRELFKEQLADWEAL